MTRTMNPLFNRFRAAQDGGVTVEFVLVFPIFLLLMAAAVEISLVTMRHTMLERGLDVVVRDIRLGTGTVPQHDEIKTRICQEARLIPNCTETLKLEMQVMDLRAYSDLPEAADCTDKAEPAAPVRAFDHGDANDLMVLRACAKYDPFLPDAMIGKALFKDSNGQAMIVSKSAFVQEPL